MILIYCSSSGRSVKWRLENISLVKLFCVGKCQKCLEASIDFIIKETLEAGEMA